MHSLVAVAPYGVSSASTRARVEEWLRRLFPGARRSYYIDSSDVRPATLARRPIDVLRAEVGLRRLHLSGCTVLLLHREATPVSRGSVERRLMSRAHRVIYDLDDALHAEIEPSLFRKLVKPPSKYAAIATRADIVITGNEVLAEWAERHCASVATIPTCVDLADYNQKVDYRTGDPPVVGWVGTFSTLGYLEMISSPLQQLHKRTGARLEVIGTGAPLPPSLASIGISIPWSRAEVRRRLATWDVGLMPLPDNSFSRGKSAYKLLQYGAVGLPPLASPIGMNARVLSEMGIEGPRDGDEWLGSLQRIVTMSEEDRRELGRRAREVARSYSYDNWSDRWRQAVLG